MKGFTNSKSGKMLFIILIALLVLVIFTATMGSSFFSSIMGFITTPAQSISTDITDNVKEYLDLDTLSFEELKVKARELSERNEQLVNQLVDYEKMKRENEQLKKQLSIEAESGDLDLEYKAAAVIMKDTGDVFGGFSIDKGYLHGVGEGDPVIGSKGLVGIVFEAYATTSVVKTIFSEDVKPLVLSQEYDESGVLTSDIKTADSGVVKMSFLKNDTEITRGTLITTSGASGMFPQEIVVGYVESVHQSETDVSKYAIVQPFEDIKNLRDVFVIIGFPGKDEAPPDTSAEEPSDNQDTEALDGN